MEQGQSPTPGKSVTTITRFAKRSCAECKHSAGQGSEMHCRRYPATVFFNTVSGRAESKYPGTEPDGFCGEQEYEGD